MTTGMFNGCWRKVSVSVLLPKRGWVTGHIVAQPTPDSAAQVALVDGSLVRVSPSQIRGC